ncbi:hypothetical protein SAMN04488008_102630 [Maribacter orientalis]|uniref:Uncharacterized protein n=1 Tax=Maribacter orientalis TaxID=228957 RepID=A0A1H7LSE1_9FLAO|nr:hypothetical protein [Maribacter orientalis]SEL01769.1 hypothetical protein SAMN04488008_102630 [Maribacter orientalis]|tara:strand:+ start:208 stop:378 length:171 start_codon:yes stop_codon:yes gene_type:complete
MKEGTEETKFIKEEEEKTKQFILQKNTKTKLGVTIIMVFLIILVIGIIISKIFFNN